MTKERFSRRAVIASAAAAAFATKAPAQGGRKPFSGVTLNVSCWNGPYPKFLADYIPDFENESGAKVNFDLPAFPIYNQRADLELSTGGSAFDVLNITFIYASRWVGAGWMTPLDPFIADKAKTAADWDGNDFLPPLVAPFRDKQNHIHGIPWIADTFMAGTPRRDLIAAAAQKLPETFDEVLTFAKAMKGRENLPVFLTENNFGWTFIPWLQGFGGNVFRDPPNDLFPMLDQPEAIAAAAFFCDLMKQYGPAGALSINYDQAAQMLRTGRAIYSTNGLPYLMQMAGPESRVSATVDMGMMPAGPKGSFPGVGVHAWGIPAGSKNKDAAWAFIQWAMSKSLVNRMLMEKRYTSVTRASTIAGSEFRKQMLVNNVDVGDLYRRTIERAGAGYMKYRTVPQFPPLNRIIAIAIEEITSGQASAEVAMRKAQELALAELRRAGTKL